MIIPTPSIPDSVHASTFILHSNDLTGLVELSDTYRVAGGGYGDIFRGHHKHFGKVALKRPHDIPDETEIYRFLREVDIWCSIEHRYILPCLGRCKIGRDIYMVSPFIDNGDLMTCIRQGVPVNRRKIVFEVAEALAHLHEQGIVHGDVKGTNILLSNEGNALLCDFGLSKVFDTMSTSTVKRGAGSTRWMAPELFNDEGHRTTASDVYSFGITIAEILSGKSPFHHLQDNNAVLFYVLKDNGRPTKEPLTDQDGRSHGDLWEVADRCWELEQSQRPSMAQILDSPIFIELRTEPSTRPIRAPRRTSTSKSPFNVPHSQSPTPTVNDLTGLVSLVSNHRIAGGVFGSIFEGHYSGYGKVALKRPHEVLGQAGINSFLREVELWCGVSHHYILPCFGACNIGPDIYMVSPLITTGSLASITRQGARLNHIKLLYEVAVAITHLHHVGIIHGNIRASSVMVSSTGTPLLGSFGFAKKMDTMITATNFKGGGSIGWMAPELFMGESKTLASDTYSFGITISEVLSGNMPYPELGDNWRVVQNVIVNERRPSMEPLFSPGGRSYRPLWAIAESCWATDPNDRPYMAQVAGMLFPLTRGIAW